MILITGKARSNGTPNLGSKGAELPGWFDVSTKNSAQDVMHEQAYCSDEATSHQLPIAAAFWIIWIVSMEVCSSLMKNLMQIHCFTYSVILNMTATQYICWLSSIYSPHWLEQWSLHCSHMLIAAQSPWLPGYIGVVQTFLIILTMARVYLDIPQCLECTRASLSITMPCD